MRPPLLTGQPAPVIPFTVIDGRVKARPSTHLTPLERLRAVRPRAAAIVDRMIDNLLRQEGE